MEKIIRYPHPNGEITVIWKPALCTHAGVCVRALPQVYRPKQRPWCKPEYALSKELIEQIEGCPSGALTYELKT